MPSAPIILSDNLLENVAVHATYVVKNFSADDVAGKEVFHVADNLRDLTSWMPTATNSARTILVDSGSGNTITANMVVLDRGHNLTGFTVTVAAYTDATLGTLIGSYSFAIPGSGGLPTDANGCVTAEGAWVKEFTALTGRVLAFTMPAMGAGVAPVVTGLYLGTWYRFPEYMNAPFSDDYDTDVVVQTSKLSRGALRVLARRLNFRRIALNIDFESTEYAAFDSQIRPMLRYGQPWWVCFDDSDATHASMTTLFQLAGAVRYQPQANPVHREVRGVDLEQVLPPLYT